MENFLSLQLAVPVYQITILLTIMTIALLFGYLKLGLFFSYIFVFYWGNLLSVRSLFENSDPNYTTVSFLYIGFGLIITFLAMIGFLLNKN
jgi:uncharacterized membrane protein